MMKHGKLFGIINIVDFIIILIVLTALLAIFMLKSARFSTSTSIIQKEGIINFDVILRGIKVSEKEEILNNNAKTFLTIRNVPYNSLQIINVEKERWKTIVPNPKDASKVIAVDDPSEPYVFNYLVTLKDKAILTKDGPVIGGNKIKIGLPITLEGFNYRLNGIVSSVKVVE